MAPHRQLKMRAGIVAVGSENCLGYLASVLQTKQFASSFYQKMVKKQDISSVMNSLAYAPLFSS